MESFKMGKCTKKLPWPLKTRKFDFNITLTKKLVKWKCKTINPIVQELGKPQPQ